MEILNARKFPHCTNIFYVLNWSIASYFRIFFVNDIKLHESVQYYATKLIFGLHNLSYEENLCAALFSLSDKRMCYNILKISK